MRHSNLCTCPDLYLAITFYWSTVFLKLCGLFFYWATVFLKLYCLAFYWSTLFLKLCGRAFYWSTGFLKIYGLTFYRSRAVATNQPIGPQPSDCDKPVDLAVFTVDLRTLRTHWLLLRRRSAVCRLSNVHTAECPLLAAELPSKQVGLCTKLNTRTLWYEGTYLPVCR